VEVNVPKRLHASEKTVKRSHLREGKEQFSEPTGKGKENSHQGYRRRIKEKRTRPSERRGEPYSERLCFYSYLPAETEKNSPFKGMNRRSDEEKQRERRKKNRRKKKVSTAVFLTRRRQSAPSDKLKKGVQEDHILNQNYLT